jgi:hypothetical protein
MALSELLTAPTLDVVLATSTIDRAKLTEAVQYMDTCASKGGPNLFSDRAVVAGIVGDTSRRKVAASIIIRKWYALRSTHFDSPAAEIAAAMEAAFLPSARC